MGCDRAGHDKKYCRPRQSWACEDHARVTTRTTGAHCVRQRSPAAHDSSITHDRAGRARQACTRDLDALTTEAWGQRSRRAHDKVGACTRHRCARDIDSLSRQACPVDKKKNNNNNDPRDFGRHIGPFFGQVKI